MLVTYNLKQSYTPECIDSCASKCWLCMCMVPYVRCGMCLLNVVCYNCTLCGIWSSPTYKTPQEWYRHFAYCSVLFLLWLGTGRFCPYTSGLLYWNWGIHVAKQNATKPGGRHNIKMPSYQYRDSHVKDKAVSPTILSLTWESPYLGKMVFILRRSPGACVMGYTVTVSFTKAPFR